MYSIDFDGLGSTLPVTYKQRHTYRKNSGTF